MEGGERVGREAAEREREGQQLEMEFPERKEVTGSPPPPPRKASEIYLAIPSFSARLGCKFDDGSMGPRGLSEYRINLHPDKSLPSYH